MDQDPELPGKLVVFRHCWTRPPGEAPIPVVLRLTADTRYKMRVNGARTAVGPSRGSDRIWYYDTIDIAPHLVPGPNVIEIEVLRCFPSRNQAWTFGRTRQPGLSVVGHDDSHDLTMGASWRVAEVKEISYPPHKLDFFLNVS